MNTINDGGSAFPEIHTDTVGERGDYRQETYSVGGMSLRDYFAAQALSGTLARPVTGHSITYLDRANDAYRYADAMLKAREE